MKCLELINLRTGPEILEVLSEKKKKKKWPSLCAINFYLNIEEVCNGLFLTQLAASAFGGNGYRPLTQSCGLGLKEGNIEHPRDLHEQSIMHHGEKLVERLSVLGKLLASQYSTKPCQDYLCRTWLFGIFVSGFEASDVIRTSASPVSDYTSPHERLELDISVYMRFFLQLMSIMWLTWAWSTTKLSIRAGCFSTSNGSIVSSSTMT